jgi:muramoyltetrapeptide carboxypeptidase
MIKLKKGDIVDIVAPAGFSEIEQLNKAIKEIKKWGLVPRTFIDFKAFHPFHSDEDTIRFTDLERAIKATDSKVIWCLRGGYGSVRLLNQLSKMKKPKNQKILIGYSDITVLHLFVNQQWGWESIHGPTISTFSNGKFDKKCFSELKEMLTGKLKNSKMELVPLNIASENSKKTIEGKLIGGNLAMVQSVIGTKFQMNAKNKILILEDVNERGYRIDRMLTHLEMTGSFKDVKAIIFGDFINGHETSGESYVEFALSRFALDSKIPIFGSNDFGHGNINRPIILNSNAKINDSILKISL